MKGRKVKQRLFAFWLRLLSAAKWLRRVISALAALTPAERAAPWKTRADVVRIVIAFQAAKQANCRELTLDEDVVSVAGDLYSDLELDLQAARHFFAGLEKKDQGVV